MTRTIPQRLIAAVCALSIVAAGCSGHSTQQDAAPVRVGIGSGSDFGSASAGATKVAPLGFGGAPASAQGGPRFTPGDGITITGLSIAITPCTNAGETQVWNGAAYVCTHASSFLNTAGANVLTKSDGTNIVASSGTDDGATVEWSPSTVFSVSQLLRAQKAVSTGVAGTDYNLSVNDLTAHGTLGTGGVIRFKARVSGADTTGSTVAIIRSERENTNSGDFASKISFATANAAGTMSRVCTMSSAGVLDCTTMTEGGSAVLSGTISSNTIPKGSSGNLANSSITDDATTVAIATNKFTVTEANGNTSIAGTLGVTGLSTLTGGFTLGADSSAASHKITNLTNGSASSDAAAFGQIATAINAAVSGTSGRSARFSGTNTIANGALQDDGTNIIGAAGDDRYFAWDNNTTARFGFTKKSGATGKLTHGSGVSFAVARSSGTDIAATNTFTDELTIDTSGNAVFTGNLTANGNTTFGTANTNTTTITGATSITMSGSGNHALSVFYTGTGQTTDRAAINSSNTGTYDATAAGRIAYGIIASSTATRSTGANNVTNRGVYANASGGQINQALLADAGDVVLNNTSGTTTIKGTAIFNAQMFAGDTGSSSIANNLDILTIGNSGTGQTSNTNEVIITHNGSFDTTGGAIQNGGLQVSLTSTRSAGSNSFQNFAILANASGAPTNNIAFRSNAGDNWFNVSSGASCFGYGAGSCPASAKINVSGSSLLDGQVDVNSHKIVNLTNGSASSDAAAFGQIASGINAAVSGTTGKFAKFTNTNVVGNAPLTDGIATDNTIVTDTGADFRTGRMYVNTPDTSEPGYRSTRNATSPGATTSNQWGFGYSSANTNFIWDYFNGTSWSGPWMTLTTAGVLNATGSMTENGTAVLSGTISSNTIPKGSSGNLADSNITDDGSTITAAVANSTGGFYVKPTVNALGNTAAFQLGAVRTDITGIFSAIQIKPVTGAGYPSGFSIDTYNSAGSALNNNIMSVAALTLRTTFPNSMTIGTDLAVNGNTTLGDATADSTTVNGAVSITDDNAAITATSNPAAVAGDTWSTFAQINGTANATAADRAAYGLIGESYTTRSAGAFNVINYGAYLDAIGGQSAYAIFANRGDVKLNSTSGTTAIGTAVDPNAKLIIDSTNIGYSLYLTHTPSAYTATAVGININSGGTINTTAGALSSFGLIAGATTTRSAGANNLINYGVYANAVNGQLNYALYSDNGDVALNKTSGNFSTDGNATLGNSDSADTAIVHGRLVGANVPADNNPSWTIQTTPSALANDVIAAQIVTSGTLNATAANRTAYGVYGQATTSRSAGANNVSNIGVFANAGSGQMNYALYTYSGDVALNANSGNSSAFNNFTVGDAAGDVFDMNGQLSKFGSTRDGLVYFFENEIDFEYSTNADPQTVNTTTDANNATGYLNYSGYNHGATRYRDLYIGDGKGAQVALFHGADKSTRLRGDLNVDGAAGIGAVAAPGVQLTVTGSGAGNVINGTFSGTAQAGDRAVLNAVNSGTYDATAANRVAYGVIASSTATRSAGANNVENRGLYATASGGQVNRALYTDFGDVIINGSGGNTVVGTTSVGTEKFLVNGVTKFIGNSTFTNSTVQIDAGTLLVDTSGAGTARLHVSSAETGLINQTIAEIDWNGSIDGTSSPVSVNGLYVHVNGSQSAGSGTTIQRAIFASATPNTGMDVSYAFYSDVGDNFFNEYSGIATFGGKIQAKVTNGAASPVASSCGTTPSVTGSDLAGIVTIGTGTATSCTVTFNTSYFAEPACIITPQSTTGAAWSFSAKSSTAFTFTSSSGSNLAGLKFNYNCWKM